MGKRDPVILDHDKVRRAVRLEQFKSGDSYEDIAHKTGYSYSSIAAYMAGTRNSTQIGLRLIGLYKLTLRELEKGWGND